MTNGLLERAARMVMRESFHFGGERDQGVIPDMPTPDTHYMRPIIHTNPMTNRAQIAEPPFRTVE